MKIDSENVRFLLWHNQGVNGWPCLVSFWYLHAQRPGIRQWTASETWFSLVSLITTKDGLPQWLQFVSQWCQAIVSIKRWSQSRVGKFYRKQNVKTNKRFASHQGVRSTIAFKITFITFVLIFWCFHKGKVERNESTLYWNKCMTNGHATTIRRTFSQTLFFLFGSFCQ